jgi:hypothetical protein
VWGVIEDSDEKANLIGALNIKLSNEGDYSDQGDTNWHELREQLNERFEFGQKRRRVRSTTQELGVVQCNWKWRDVRSDAEALKYDLVRWDLPVNWSMCWIEVNWNCGTIKYDNRK